jgi:probable phosphoglycerate mutase
VARAQDIVLVRHGETEWSASGRHTSSTDIALTDAGRAQAAALAPALQAWRFARVVTSPFDRARTTCAVAGFADGAMVDDRLREWGYGRYEGRTTVEIQQEDPGWTVWRGPTPGGEPLEAVAARVDELLAELVEVDGDVLLLSHGHLLRILAARWMGQPAVEGRRLLLDTGSVSVLSAEHGTQGLRRWNEVPAGGGPPTSTPQR